MDFEALIRAFGNPDNTVRGRAEEQIQELRNHPDVLVTELVKVLRTSVDETVRATTAVLVRKTISKETFEQLSPQSQAILKQELLMSVEQEVVPHIQKKVSDTVGEIASYLPEGSWPELLQFMFRCAKSPSAPHRECALLMFGQLSMSLEKQVQSNLPTLKDLLGGALQDPESSDVRLAALRATASFLPCLENKKQKLFQDMIPPMLQVLSATLPNDELSARSALEELIDIADSCPSFLKPQAQVILEAMYTIASTKELEDATRHLGVECLVTLAEKAPGMVRKVPRFVQLLLPLALNMMLEIEDDAEWYSGGTGEEDDTEYTSYDIGEECLDRVAIALGGRTVLPIAFEPTCIPAYLQNPDWRNRHAALMTISQIGEGCQQQMAAKLEDVVGMLLRHFGDPHARVRWAAINAVGQLSTDFGPDLQKKMHAAVIPALVAVMDDTGNPRVQSHAAAAVINFTENCTSEIISGYLDGLLSKLLALLQNGQRIVQEQAITAIASVADCAEQLFRPYYAMTMPMLKQILALATGKQDRMLRGKAMECISLIGIAVGKEVFGQDAKEVMDMMMALQSAELEPDDPQISYLLQAWGRIAKSLGTDFIPYLQYVMPALLKSAGQEPDIVVSDADEGADEQENMETITVNNKRISIQTSVLEEKATACNMICCYITELKTGFLPWIDPVAKIMVPLVKFIYHDEVRSAAVTCMPELIKCAMEAAKMQQCDANYLRSLLDFVMKSLLEAVKVEPDVEVLVTMANAIHEGITAAGEACLNAEQVKLTVEAIKMILTESFDRRQELNSKKDDEDFDEEEGEVIEDEHAKEEELLDETASIVGALLKTCAKDFIDNATPVLDLYGQMLAAAAPTDRRQALCVFDDVFEHAMAFAAPMLGHVLPYFMKGAQDEDAEVRQAAVYGLGVCAQHGAATFAPMALEATQVLITVINKPDSRTDPNEMATDNAISALGKMLMYQAASVNPVEVGPIWLSYLPLTSDEVEAKAVHSQLTSLVEQSVPWALGDNYKNIPQIVVVFARILESEYADEATQQRIVQQLQRIRTEMPQELLQMAWTNLDETNRAKLQKFVS